jgi:hypothetical protein
MNHKISCEPNTLFAGRIGISGIHTVGYNLLIRQALCGFHGLMSKCGVSISPSTTAQCSRFAISCRAFIITSQRTSATSPFPYHSGIPVKEGSFRGEAEFLALRHILPCNRLSERPPVERQLVELNVLA